MDSSSGAIATRIDDVTLGTTILTKVGLGGDLAAPWGDLAAPWRSVCVCLCVGLGRSLGGLGRSLGGAGRVGGGWGVGWNQLQYNPKMNLSLGPYSALEYTRVHWMHRSVREYTGVR